VWNERLIGVAFIALLVLTLAVLVWSENERRYDAFRFSGCLDDAKQSALGVSQPCTGARRLCRDAPPLIDWRHACD
jgi:hypothetical protein